MPRIVAVVAACLWIATPAIASASGNVAAALQQLLAGIRTTSDMTDVALDDFYALRGYEPLWVTAEGRSPAGRRVLSLLEHAENEGLNPAEYQVPQPGGVGAIARAQDERNITRTVLRYARHRSVGRIGARQMGARYHQPAEPVDPGTVLRAMAAADDPLMALAAIGPQDDGFRHLRWASERLRGVVAAGGWGRVAVGPTIWPGDTSPRVAEVRRTLWRRGDFRAPEASDSLVYDPALVEAVRRFQQRHGLHADGAIGQGTVAAMNVPASARLEQLQVNIERRRWHPPAPTGRHIAVNLPAYEMVLMEGETVIFASRVVVGAKKHETPEFSADMTYLVLNPHWYVPATIANEEMLPELKKNPHTYTDKGFRAFASLEGQGREVDWASVDWAALETVPVYIRQDPGRHNALGTVKFMLPNRDNIYLHDTNAKRLFDKDHRAFSHGCIRVADPMGLATHLLQPVGGWDRERLVDFVETGSRRTLVLREPVPVRMLYHTAWVDQDGVMHFRRDVYGRDRVMARLLRPGA